MGETKEKGYLERELFHLATSEEAVMEKKSYMYLGFLASTRMYIMNGTKT